MVGEVIYLGAGEGGGVFDADGFDCFGFGEDGELSIFEIFGQVYELHIITQIGLVGAVSFCGFLIGDAGDGFGDEFFAAKIGDEIDNERLDGLADGFAVVDKGHFEVELVEVTV